MAISPSPATLVTAMKAQSVQQNNSMSSSSSESQSEIGERSKDAQDANQESIDQNALKGAFDVITVHGLHGDSQSTWEARDPEKRGELDGILTLESELECRVLNYGYDRHGAFSGSDIILEASKLLRYISNARLDLEPETRRPIVIVSHDIGGAIAKRALYLASTDPEYANIAHSTRRLIFYGYPHRCRDIQQMADAVARDVLPESDLASLSMSYFRIIGLAQTIMDCNDLFVESKFMLRANLINIYSSKTNPGEYVFDEWMATTGLVGEVKISNPELHANLACAPAKLDAWWTISIKLGEFQTNHFAPEQEDDQNRDLSVFSSPPIYLTTRSTEELSWLTNHENFTTWRNNNRSCGLIVQTSNFSDDISGSIFETITEEKAENSIYFSFDCHDNRRSNIRTFLDAAMSQWTQNWPNALRENAGYPHLLHYRSFTESDALYTWTMMLTRIASIFRTKTFFVLNNVHESGDTNPSFWEHLASLFENQESGPWKFILFTKPGHEMHEGLSHWPRINMDEQEIRPGLDHDMEQEISLNHTQLLYFRSLRIPRRLLGASICKGNWKDIGLAPFMTGQLLRVVRRPTGISSEAFIQRLQHVSPEELAGETMIEVPEEDRTFVSDVLSWIICAVRPLSLDELQSASILMMGKSIFNRSLDLALALDELLPGMLDFSNRRVRFSHRRLHDFFERAEDVWFAIRHTAHGLIAQVCLDSLRSTGSLDALFGLCNLQHGILGAPIFKPQNNLTSYAVEYWPQHYSLASNRSSLLDLVMKLFSSEKIVRKWEAARWIITNPVTRTDRSYLKSLLPLIASTGLCDAFHQQFRDEKQNSASEAISHLPFALAEASRNGHAELANDILQLVNLNETQTAELVLLAAVSYGENEDLQISLAVHVSDQHLENFTWPDPLIFRASWLGQARLVEKLIECNANIRTRGEYYDRPNLLQATLLNGHLEVARILLSEDKSLAQEVDDAGRTALGYAANNARPEVATLLLSNGRGVDVRHSGALAVGVACSRGNYAVLSFLLEKGAETEPLGEKTTPLADAASHGFVKCVKALLKHGANPNGGGEDGPAIAQSAMWGHFDIVQLLVDKKAAVNVQADEEIPNAIVAAVLNNENAEMVGYLLKHDADVESKFNLRLIFFAIGGSNVEILRAVLQAGADMKTPGENGLAPIHFACLEPAKIRALAETDRTCIEQAADGDGSFPLYLATSAGEMDAVEVLLEYNPNVDQLCKNADGQSSTLHIAAENFNTGIARKLLEAGADVNLRTTPGGHSALHLGASNEEFLKMLLDFEPDINLTDNRGNTALNYYLASEGAELFIVKMLVLEGSDINKANKDGITPLHRATTQKTPEIARLLIKLGADVNAISGRLGAPLHVACWLGTPETVKLLVKANANVMQMHPKSGHPACSAGYRVLQKDDYERAQKETNDILRYILHEGDKTVNVNRVGGEYGCILGMVCYYCSTETIDLVLSAKADVNLQATLGRRPIHFAAYSTVENLRKLKESDADLYVRDSMGRTILHCAVQGGNVDLVKYVLRETEDLLHMADNDGWTPLHYAARGCDVLGHERRIERRGQSAEGGQLRLVPFGIPNNYWRAPLHCTTRDHDVLDRENGIRRRGRNDAEEEQFQIVSHLVEQGSKIMEYSSGPDRRWTPAMLAQFHGARKDTQDLLMPRNADNKTWPDGPRKIGRAHTKDVYCNCCFAKIEGLNYKCKLCNNVDLCYKCYPVREYSQHRGHGWEEIGPEYVPDDSEEPEERSASASVSESENET